MNLQRADFGSPLCLRGPRYRLPHLFREHERRVLCWHAYARPSEYNPVYCQRVPFQQEAWTHMYLTLLFQERQWTRQSFIIGHSDASAIEPVGLHLEITQTLESPPPYIARAFSSTLTLCCTPSSTERPPIVGSRVDLIHHVPFEFSTTPFPSITSPLSLLSSARYI